MTTDSHPNPNPDRWQEQVGQGRDDSDATRAFWGDGAGWASQPTDSAPSPEAASSPRGLAATVARWWSSTTSGQRGGTRAHTPPAAPTSRDDADDVHHEPDTDWDDAWETAPPEPPRSGVDPLLARLGGLVVVLTLLVPVVMGFDSDDGRAVRSSPGALDVSTAAGGDQPAEPAATATALGSTTTPAPAATSPVTDAAVAGEVTTPVTEYEVVAPVVEELVDCALEYEVVAGDFWIRIADGSGAALADVLAVNDSTVSTSLYPGRSICLPEGATTPPSPVSTTAAPTSTASPTTRTSGTSSSGSTASATPATAPPVTTPATTPPPLPASSAGPGEVEAIIRSVWPDELEARALEVAWRESNYKPTARNSCCYGVFQVYWSVHRSWLSDLGITSADQLYDPATNARAALALYLRAGGWGPWGG